MAKQLLKSASVGCSRKKIVLLPKSTHEKYIIENADVFDFALPAEDMAAIDAITYCGGMRFDPGSAWS